jgi:hypothetical protein
MATRTTEAHTRRRRKETKEMFPKLFSGVLGCVKNVKVHLDNDSMQGHIMRVISRLPTKTERLYSQVQKETLGVV